MTNADEAAIVWLKRDHGTEIATVRLGETSLDAWGCSIGAEPMPYRLDYKLVTTDGFITSSIVIEARGANWHRTLDLRRDDNGEWLCKTSTLGSVDLAEPGGDMARLTGALDCDLGLCPLTNSMPILRHGIHKGGGPYDFKMAWIRVPELSVHLSEQQYACLRSGGGVVVIQYKSGRFSADLDVDDRGIVTRYPGLAHQICPSGVDRTSR